jgi:hypothetical protein
MLETTPAAALEAAAPFSPLCSSSACSSPTDNTGVEEEPPNRAFSRLEEVVTFTVYIA